MAAVDPGGVVAPGNSIGTLTAASVALAGTYQCEVGGDASDQLVVSGLLTLTGAIDFDVTASLTESAYILCRYGSLSGVFSSAIDLPAGYHIDYAFDDGIGSNHIALVAFPPELSISAAGPGQAEISWSPNTTGYVLQEAPTLSPAAWTNAPSGATNPVTLPATNPATFYRVFKP